MQHRAPERCDSSEKPIFRIGTLFYRSSWSKKSKRTRLENSLRSFDKVTEQKSCGAFCAAASNLESLVTKGRLNPTPQSTTPRPLPARWPSLVRVRVPAKLLQIVALLQPLRTRVPAALAQCARSEEHTSELQSRLHLVCR